MKLSLHLFVILMFAVSFAYGEPLDNTTLDNSTDEQTNQTTQDIVNNALAYNNNVKELSDYEPELLFGVGGTNNGVLFFRLELGTKLNYMPLIFTLGGDLYRYEEDKSMESSEQKSKDYHYAAGIDLNAYVYYKYLELGMGVGTRNAGDKDKENQNLYIKTSIAFRVDFVKFLVGLHTGQSPDAYITISLRNDGMYLLGLFL